MIIERNNKKEVLISKYNEAESGISTELDIKLKVLKAIPPQILKKLKLKRKMKPLLMNQLRKP